MKIHYKDNPLSTIVELNPTEIKLLLAKIKIEEFENVLNDMWAAAHEQNCTISEFIESIDRDFWTGDQIDHRTMVICKDAILALADTHLGDCTATPFSCVKCYAEGLLGIDTIPGLKKERADLLYSEFTKHETIDLTIDDVIDSLTNFNDDKFKEVAISTREWLINYKNTHLIGDRCEEIQL